LESSKELTEIAFGHYHDEVCGTRRYDESAMFEALTLGVFEVGLSSSIVFGKREPRGAREVLRDHARAGTAVHCRPIQVDPAIEVAEGGDHDLAVVVCGVDGEAGVVGEERLLALGVAAVGAVRVRVEELAQGEPVGGFSRAEFGVVGDGQKILRSDSSTSALSVFAVLTTRVGDEAGNDLARLPANEVVGGPVVGRVDDDRTVSVETFDGLGHAVPGHGNDDDVGRCRFVHRPRRDPLAEGRDH
jgi:Methyladenine glycosylase